MPDLLDPAVHPWANLVPPDTLINMRAHLTSGSVPGHCAHGDPLETVICSWRTDALERAQPPVDWTGFDPARELWFAFLGPADQLACQAEFALAQDDAERTELFASWRSTGAVLSDPELAARLRTDLWPDEFVDLPLD